MQDGASGDIKIDTSASGKYRKFRSDINLLRAIAVLSVVFYHFKVPGFDGGFCGVDIFFVISGFLMTQIIIKGSLDLSALWAFFRGRAVRIFPAMAVMVAAVAALSILLIDPAQQSALLQEAGYVVTFTSNIFYARTINYFAPNANDRWFLHTWSLAVEWQFYIIYPIFMIVYSKIFGSKKFLYALIAIFAFSLALLLSKIVKNDNYAFYLLPFRAWEMALGGLAFLLPARRWTLALAIAGYAALVASLIILRSDQAWPSAWSLWPTLATAAILSANVDVSRNPGYRIFHVIGLSSYSIYLVHWPILVYLNYIGAAGPSSIFIGIALSAALGFASYYFVEKTSQNLLRPRGPAFVWIGGIGLAACFWLTVPVHQWVLNRPGALYGVPTQHWRDYIAAPSDGPKGDLCGDVNKTGAGRGPCVFKGGAADGPSVLVIGDSHAEMWVPRLATLAASPAGAHLNRIAVAARDGCPVLQDLDNPPRPCAEFNRKAMALATSGQFRRVIIISLWSYYQASDASLCQPQGRSCAKLTGPAARRIGLSSFESNIAKLTAKGEQVTILLPPPDSHWDTPKELARRLFLKQPIDGVAWLPRDEQERKRGDVKQDLERISRLTGARLLDPFDLLCTPSRCDLLDPDGVVRFKDSNHLRGQFVKTSTFLDEAVTGGGVQGEDFRSTLAQKSSSSRP